MTAETFRILHGDARDMLIDLPDRSMDCVVTSPPYFAQRDYGNATQIGLERTVEKYLDDLAVVFDQCHRLLIPRGVMWINIGDTFNAYNGNRGEGTLQSGKRNLVLPQRPKGYGLTDPSRPNKALLNVPARLAERLAETGWLLRSDVIWKKTVPMPGSSQDRPRSTYEHVLLFAKQPRYFFDRTGLDGDEDVWMLPSSDGLQGDHSAAYPTALASRCVRTASAPGGLVLDPFCGSGSTGAAALLAGRRFVGVDLNETSAQFTVERLTALLEPPRM